MGILFPTLEDLLDKLKHGQGKWGDGDTHAAKTEWTAEDVKNFTPRPSDEQLKAMANAPTDDKLVKNPKKLDPDYYKKFAVET